MPSAVIVLAMHGMPPADFPRHEAAELFQLHAQLAHVDGPAPERLERRYAVLDAKMRTWPRTLENDPFAAGSDELAAAVREAAGVDVVVGYNEFCAPSLAEALDIAASRASRVIVVTPMMTRGGEHSERDIPAAVKAARARHPAVVFTYVWPFDLAAVAQFLADQISDRTTA